FFDSLLEFVFVPINAHQSGYPCHWMPILIDAQPVLRLSLGHYFFHLRRRDQVCYLPSHLPQNRITVLDGPSTNTQGPSEKQKISSPLAGVFLYSLLYQAKSVVALFLKAVY